MTAFSRNPNSKERFVRIRKAWARARQRWIKRGLPPISKSVIDGLRYAALQKSHAEFCKWLGFNEEAGWKIKKALDLPGAPVPVDSAKWDSVQLGEAPDEAISILVGVPVDEVKNAREHRDLPSFGEIYNPGDVCTWIGDLLELIAQMSADMPLGYRTSAMAWACKIRAGARYPSCRPPPYLEDDVLREKLRGILGLSAEESLGFDGVRAGADHRAKVRARRNGNPVWGTDRGGLIKIRESGDYSIWRRGDHRPSDTVVGAEVVSSGNSRDADERLQHINSSSDERTAESEREWPTTSQWGQWRVFDGDPFAD